jgi:hypothetical protein
VEAQVDQISNHDRSQKAALAFECGLGRDFPNGNLPAVVEAQTTESNRSLAGFASLINSLSRCSAVATLKLAEVVSAAQASLDPEELDRLAELTKYSPGTFSKLIKIANCRARFEPLVGRLPAGWTVLYHLARLEAEQLDRLDAICGIRPDLTIRDIESFLDRTKRSGHETAAPADNVEPESFCELATIQVSTSLPAEAKERISELLKSCLADQPVHLDFPEPRGKAEQRHREKMVVQLRTALGSILASHCEARNAVNQSRYEAIESAAWQHQHKDQKGAYPYAASDPNSIEHVDHQFWIGGKNLDRRAFLRYLRTEKIITPYSPLVAFAHLGEARCIKYAIDYCEALSAKPRSLSKTRLQEVIANEPANAAFAKKYLDMISSRGEGI